MSKKKKSKQFHRLLEFAVLTQNILEISPEELDLLAIRALGERKDPRELFNAYQKHLLDTYIGRYELEDWR